jgi:hypothetical protein
VEALQPILSADQRPSWVGPAAFIIPAPQGGPPTLALYPVCFAVGDDRCGASVVVAHSETHS